MKIKIKHSIQIVQKIESVKIFILLLLSIFQFRYGVIPAWNHVNSDFPNYYTSSRLLIEGRDMSKIYNDTWFQQEIIRLGINEQGKFSPFPPPTVFVMTPVAQLSPLAAKRVYLIFSLILVPLAAYFVKKISGFSFTDSCIIILLSGAALSIDLLLGQFYLILLTMILWGYKLFLKEDGYSAGVLWGIGAALKYFPLIYLPSMVLKKDWKAVASMIITIFIINAAACLAAGLDVYSQFLQKVLFSHLNGELSSQSNYAFSFQSWNSFLRNLFVYDRFDNISPVYNSLAAFYCVRAVVYIVFTAAAILVLYRLRKNKNIIVYYIIILSFLSFVLSPASASYHLLLLILPVILLLKLASGLPPLYSIYFIVLYAIIGFSPIPLRIMNKNTVGLFLSFGRLWLIVTLYISALGFILLHSRRNKTEDYDFLSTIPNTRPSSIES